MSTYFTILTDAGAAALTDAMTAQREIIISEFAVGDGGGAGYDPSVEDLKPATQLANEVYRANVNAVEEDANQNDKFYMEGIIPVEVGGFTVREVGWFLDTGELFAVSTYPPSYKTSLDEGASTELPIKTYIITDAVENIVLQVDPTVTYATRGYVDQQIEASNSNSVQLIDQHIANSHMAQFSKSISKLPAFTASTVSTVVTQCELVIALADNLYKIEEGAVVSMPEALTIGTDYAIYLTENGLIASDNFTVPDGYTAENSRRIGGFHFGGKSGGSIYERSFYDINFRPACDDPRGMVRSFAGFWADIYFCNTATDVLGTSAYGVTIADGATPPKIPSVFGGDGSAQHDNFSQYTAAEVLGSQGKRLPNQHEFTQLALGSTPLFYNEVEPISTGHIPEAISLIGCEQVTGVMWNWGSEVWDRGRGYNVSSSDSRYSENENYLWLGTDNDTNGDLTVAPNTNGQGSIYALPNQGVGASIFGGSWTVEESGPRCSTWSNEPWDSTSNVSARGVCDHLCLV